jgi:hypothetical protein
VARSECRQRRDPAPVAHHFVGGACDHPQPAGARSGRDHYEDVPIRAILCEAAIAAEFGFHGGASLFASYWDTGTIQLNISRPNHPAFVGRAKIWPPDEDGDNHSLDLQGDREFINPEDFCVGRQFGSWGEVSVYDRSDPAKPSFESTFSTPNSRSTSHRGIFTVHNTEVVAEDQAFSSWYSDGIQWWEIVRSGATFSRGWFVPPPTPDPQVFFPPFRLVWGVYPHSGMNLILASDINSGLWILDPVGLNNF